MARARRAGSGEDRGARARRAGSGEDRRGELGAIVVCGGEELGVVAAPWELAGRLARLARYD